MEVFSEILKEFMSFIRREYLEELTIKNISLLKTINVPLMRYFTHFTDEELINSSRIKLDSFLKDFEEGKAYEIAEKNFKLWEIDKLHVNSVLEIEKLPSLSMREIDKLPGLSILEIDKVPSLSIDSIEPTDLVFFDVAQKQSLFHFIPKFTKDTEIAIKIIEALEDYYMKTQAAAFYLYTRLKAKSVVQALKLKVEGEAKEEKAVVQALKLKEEGEAREEKAVVQALKLKEEGEAREENAVVQALKLKEEGEAREEKAVVHALKLKEEGEAREENAVIEALKLKLEGEAREEKAVVHALKLKEEGEAREENAVIEALKLKLEGEAREEKAVVHALKLKLEGEAREEKASVQAFKLKLEVEAREEKAKVLALKLKIEREAIEFANKELESFSYSVSHDLRTPLRSIDGFSLALLDNYSEQLDAKGKDFLNRIRTATQRMGQLIDELLKLSQLSKSEVTFENVNLSELTNTIITELSTINPEQKVTCNIEDNLTANCDKTLMTMVLENLYNNAFKFTGKSANAHIEFGFKKVKEKNAFFIKDNGAGFDMEYSNLLFGAFQRLHRVTDFPGNGIGLATVKRIILKHGGEIWAEGEVNKGATFFFTLPV